MAGGKAEAPRSNGGRPSRRSLVLMLAALLIVVVVVVVVVVLVTRDDKQAGVDTGDGTAGTIVTSPFDMIEVPGDVSLDLLSKASFVSILVPNESGTLTSYGVSSELAAAQALIGAVSHADEVDEQLAAAVTASTVPLEGGGTGGTATITFVFASRETITFALSLDQGLVARAGKAWRPKGDLQALVQAAIKSPQ